MLDMVIMEDMAAAVDQHMAVVVEEDTQAVAEPAIAQAVVAAEAPIMPVLTR
jgi:hypothetical protein